MHVNFNWGGLFVEGVSGVPQDGAGVSVKYSLGSQLKCLRVGACTIVSGFAGTGRRGNPMQSSLERSTTRSMQRKTQPQRSVAAPHVEQGVRNWSVTMGLQYME